MASKRKKLSTTQAKAASKMIREIRAMKKSAKGKLSTSNSKKAKSYLRKIRNMKRTGVQKSMF